jgi:hypothetical protein
VQVIKELIKIASDRNYINLSKEAQSNNLIYVVVAAHRGPEEDSFSTTGAEGAYSSRAKAEEAISNYKSWNNESVKEEYKETWAEDTASEGQPHGASFDIVELSLDSPLDGHSAGMNTPEMQVI